MKRYDVAIIGGGVAGLSAASSICEKIDASVLIIEKGEIGDPKKTSPFTFPDVVERFNLSDAVLQKYKRLTYKSPTGVSASFDYENPAFVTVDYQKMCNILLGKIKKEGNVSVLEGTEALSLSEDRMLLPGALIKLRLSDSTEISCSVLVDASGSSFFAANKLQIDLPELYSHPYGEFLEECQIDDPEEMCVFTGTKYGNGGGWFYPIGKRAARFGFATISGSRASIQDKTKNNFEKAIRDFYPYNEMLAGSKTKRSEFGIIPIGALKKLVCGSILIVGDAAGQATPWYNEGVRPALEAGQMCGETVVEAYEKGKFRKKTLAKYENTWNAQNRKTYAYAKVRALSYFRSQEQWDASVRYQSSLTPEQMMKIIRFCIFLRVRSKSLSNEFRSHGVTGILKEIVLRIYDKMKHQNF